MTRERKRREGILAQYKRALDDAQDAYDNGWSCGCGAICIPPHAAESLATLEKYKDDYNRTKVWCEEVS